jgi:hypothetical protein
MQFGAFRECPIKQRDGVAVPFGTATFFIRRWGTKESEKFLVKLKREIFGPFSEEPEHFPELVANWLANYGVVGWTGIYNDEGTELIPYSERMAREIFLDPAFWYDMNMKLFGLCQSYEHFLVDIAKEDGESIKK